MVASAFRTAVGLRARRRRRTAAAVAHNSEPRIAGGENHVLPSMPALASKPPTNSTTTRYAAPNRLTATPSA
jgi:hypothetical protein